MKKKKYIQKNKELLKTCGNNKIKNLTMIFFKIRDVKSPERGTPQSAGIDFFVPKDFNEGRPYSLLPQSDVLIPSGIKVGLPENTMLMGADKSGIASSRTAKARVNLPTKEGAWDSSIVVGAKIIDRDYPGELHIHLINTGSQAVTIIPDMKVAQFIIVPVLMSAPVEVFNEKDLGIAYTCRVGGFGSTNK